MKIKCCELIARNIWINVNHMCETQWNHQFLAISKNKGGVTFLTEPLKMMYFICKSFS